MHCVSTYPCKDEDLNLSMINKLKNDFKCPVGYSGHENSVSPSLIAYLLGAEFIERHITLDRAMWELINRPLYLKAVLKTYQI